VVFGELGNFPLWGVDLGHCVDSFRWFLGRGNFPLWGHVLGHCVDGFRLFSGSSEIFFYGGLIWDTV
jgi:hypothetical protein